MGRRKAPEKIIKDTVVKIRVSQQDRARIHSLAHSQGMSISVFIRRFIDDELLDYEKSNKLFSDAEEYLSTYQNGELN